MIKAAAVVGNDPNGGKVKGGWKKETVEDEEGLLLGCASPRIRHHHRWPLHSMPLAHPSSPFTAAAAGSLSPPQDESLRDQVAGALRKPELLPVMAPETETLGGPPERGGCDGFSVEELLDLGDFMETELEVKVPPPPLQQVKQEEEDGGRISDDDEKFNGVTGAALSPALPPAEIDLPSHDAEELEWVSRMMDDSLAELPPPQMAAALALRRSQQPLCTLSTQSMVPVKAKRSPVVYEYPPGPVKANRTKRARRPAGSDSSSSSTTTAAAAAGGVTLSSSSSSTPVSPFRFLYQYPLFVPKLPHEKQPRVVLRRKKPGRKPKAPPPSRRQASPGPPGSERRCSHCGSSKTPQWRAGPQGAKTLCNACGVRYKSGRLLPEYRPACSPTFVGTVHSNSHRKVLEIRKKKEAAGILPPVTVAASVASF